MLALFFIAREAAGTMELEVMVRYGSVTMAILWARTWAVVLCWTVGVCVASFRGQDPLFGEVFLCEYLLPQSDSEWMPMGLLAFRVTNR